MERNEDEIPKCKKRKWSENGCISSQGSTENTQESDCTEEYNNSLFSQETQPYSPNIQAELEEGHVYEQNGKVDSTIGDHEEVEVPKMNKLESVMEDAKFIGDILNDIELSDIYNRLKAIRQNPNRIEIVTNQLLESQSKKATVHKPTCTSNSIMQDFVKIIDLTTTNMSALPVSAEEIQELLDSAQHRNDRVDYVFSQILGLYCLKRQGHGDIVKDIKTILVQCPGAPFDEVSKMMLQKKNLPDRIQQTLDFFLPQLTKLPRNDSSVSTSSLTNDMLYKDTRIIAKVMPEIDRNEIYAYLEAHYNEKNRIQVVIEELMKTKSDSGESLPSLDISTDAEFVPKLSKGIFNIQDEVDELREIFPDCDPNYLFEQLELKANDKERMKSVAMGMFDNKSYPKLKDREDHEKKNINKTKNKKSEI